MDSLPLEAFSIVLPRALHPKEGILDALGVLGRQERAAHFIAEMIRRAALPDSKNGWVAVNSVISRNLYGRHAYHAFKEMLVSEGLLEVNDSYRAGHYSKTMRISNKWLEDPLPYEIQSNFLKKLHKIEREKQGRPLPESAEVMKSQFHLISLNGEKSSQVLDRERNPYKRASILRSIEAMSRLPRFKAGRTGRIFTPLTNMPKSLRCHLHYDGERFHEADIKSCQPLMLGKLLNDSSLIKACRKGDVYSMLGSEFYKLTGKKITRDKVKLEVMVYVLNAKRIHGHAIWKDTPIDKAFESLFPTAHKALEGKVRNIPGRSKELIATLQGMEADVIFNSILPKAQTFSPVSFTIHDSVAVPSLFSDSVNRLMENELDKFL